MAWNMSRKTVRLLQRIKQNIRRLWLLSWIYGGKKENLFLSVSPDFYILTFPDLFDF